METTRKRRKWPWIVSGIATVFVVLGIWYGGTHASEETISYEEYTVTRNDIAVTVSESGTIEASEVLSLEVPAGIRISDVLVEAGDVVTEGAVLATLDEESLAKRAADLANEISSLETQLASVNSNEKICAPAEGRIKHIGAQEGLDVLDVMEDGGSLAVLSTDGKMQVEFISDADMELGEDVTVQWSSGEADGEICARTNDGYLVTLSDKNAPMAATSKIWKNDVLLGEGILEIRTPLGVYGTGGTIDDVHVEVGEYVQSGATLFDLQNAPRSAAYMDAVQDQESALQALNAVLSYTRTPQIVAPATGIISAVYAQEDTDVGTQSTPVSGAEGAASAQSGTGSESVDVFDLKTDGTMTMTVHVNELDIPGIRIGQSARISIDAYPNDTFSATVTRISMLGQSEGSMTAYPVELTLDKDERLMDGMNGSAVITVDSTSGVLTVPLEAISEDATGMFVHVKDADGQPRRANIQTGLSDGLQAQVTEGLQEGDTVLTEAAQATVQFPAPGALIAGKSGEQPQESED